MKNFKKQTSKKINSNDMYKNFLSSKIKSKSGQYLSKSFFIAISILIIVGIIVATVYRQNKENVDVLKQSVYKEIEQNSKDAIQTEDGNIFIVSVGEQGVFRYNLKNQELTQLSIPAGYEVSAGYPTGYLPTSKKIFLLKDDQLYLFDIVDSTIKKTSIPALKDEGDIFELVNNILLSPDRTDALIEIGIYDKNSEQYDNEEAGPQPASTREMIYNLSQDKYEDVDILKMAKNIIYKNDKNRISDQIFFEQWDNKNNKLFAHPWSAGIGSTPAYIVDLKNKTFIESPDNVNNTYTGNLFSPSLKKFVLVDNLNNWHESDKDISLLIFDSNNPSDSQKTISIKDIVDKHCQYYEPLAITRGGNCYNKIDSITWSPDETQVAIAFDAQIYTVNLDTGEAILRFTDNTLNESDFNWEQSTLLYSQSGNYIFFIDGGRSHYNYMGEGMNNARVWDDENDKYALKAIDLTTNKIYRLQDFNEQARIFFGI